MQHTRRWRLWFFSVAAGTTVAVVLWSAHSFTAIWLRARCARELASHAEPMVEAILEDRSPSDPNRVGLEGPALDALLFSEILISSHHSNDELLDRLEELQQASVATVLRHLFGRRGRDDTASATLLANVVSSLVVLVDRPSVVSDRSADGEPETAHAEVLDQPVTEPLYVSDPRPNNLFELVFRVSQRATHYYSVSDTCGEKLLLVTRPVFQEATTTINGFKSFS